LNLDQSAAPGGGVTVVGCVRQNGPVDNIWIGHVFPPAWPGLSGMVPESPGIPRFARKITFPVIHHSP